MLGVLGAVLAGDPITPTQRRVTAKVLGQPYNPLPVVMRSSQTGQELTLSWTARHTGPGSGPERQLSINIGGRDCILPIAQVQYLRDLLTDAVKYDHEHPLLTQKRSKPRPTSARAAEEEEEDEDY